MTDFNNQVIKRTIPQSKLILNHPYYVKEIKKCAKIMKYDEVQVEKIVGSYKKIN